MEKIYNKEDAEDFFLKNHSDSVICVKDGIEKEANCYPDAIAFFN